MDRNQLENAIYELRELLKVDEIKEEKFQAYFEKYEVVFNVLGYSKAYPHLSLELTDELKEKFNREVLIPDFFTQKIDGNIDIFELKTPQESLVKDKRGKTSFYAKINDYIAQVIQYSEYFEDQENRNLFKKKHALDIQKKIDVVIVAGRDSDLDKKQLHDEMRRRSNHLDIITFDDILNRLVFSHTKQFGDASSYSSGAGMYSMMRLNNTSRDLRKYIFDVGDSLEHRRWSIFLNKNNAICSEIIDDEGEIFSVKASSLSKIDTDKPFHLMCQFATNGQCTILQILVDNQTVGESRIDGMLKISSDALKNFSGLKFSTIGADIKGNNANGGFDIYAFAITAPLNFLQLRDLAARTYSLKENTGWQRLSVRPGAYIKMR
jgi:hypothetical protein